MPIRLGIIIHLVLGIINLITSSTSGTYFPIATSQKTGFAPNCMIGATVVEKVQAGVITSSPGPTPNAAKDNKQAEEPELTKSPYFFPKY